MRSETSGDAAPRLRVEIAVAGACVMLRHHAAMGFTIAGLVLRIGFGDSQKGVPSRAPNGSFRDFRENIFVAKSCDSESVL
jgi:hypothetical protein